MNRRGTLVQWEKDRALLGFGVLLLISLFKFFVYGFGKSDGETGRCRTSETACRGDRMDRQRARRMPRADRAGAAPLSRGGRPVCCVSMRPGAGLTASFTGAVLDAALEFFLRALV